MLIVMILILASAFYFDYLRQFDSETIRLNYSSRILQIKYRLTDQVQRGNIQENNWLYQFLNNAMENFIANIEIVSFWKAIFLWLTQKPDQELIDLRKKLNEELNKPTNSAVIDYYREYYMEVVNYLWSRHAFLRFVTKRSMEYWILKQLLIKIQSAWRELLDFNTIEPSTLKFANNISLSHLKYK